MYLDLSKHCIQTEIRRLYNQSVSLYFKLEKEDLQLAADIELLKNALENLEFTRLRSAYGALAGGRDDRAVELVADGQGGVIIRIDGQDIA